MDLIAVTRMSRDIRKSAETLSDDQVRFLVGAYYDHQEDRIANNNRAVRLGKDGLPHDVLAWLSDQSDTIETQLRGALGRYASAHPIGHWMQSIKGIGPVISAGLLANIDIKRANTVGKIWAVCGLAPGKDKRVRGQRIAFNPALKRIAWLASQSFKRLSDDDDQAVYRHVYSQRKAYEAAKNEAGDYADQARAALEKKKFGEDTIARKAYEAGKLPPGHLDARAARYAVKMFLSDLHRIWWEWDTGSPPPDPYPIAILGHADLRKPGNIEEILADLRRRFPAQ